MNQPTILNVDDEDRIEALRRRLGAETSLQVIRKGLERLEGELNLKDAIGTSSEQVLYDVHEEAPDAGGA